MRKLFCITLAMTVAACGETNHPKSYYEENADARAEMRSWCDDNPAQAQERNCVNAEAAYKEVYRELRERRNAERQPLAKQLEEVSWVGKCLGPDDINKCRDEFEAKAIPIREALEEYKEETSTMLEALR